MPRSFITIIVVIMVSLSVVLYDAYCFYPYSTRTSLEIDTTSLGGQKNAWCTTHDGVIDMCLTDNVWYIYNFQPMSRASRSSYTTEVGATRAKSVLFGRNGSMLWRGRILIVIENDSDSFDVFLIDGVAESFSIKVEKEHRIRGGMKLTDLHFDRE